MYCTYLTIYSGDKLPKRYLGSTSLKKIKKGYRGSVASEDYRELWEDELRDNPQLFKTRVLNIHYTREEATRKELELHQKYQVVKNENFVNKALAKPNGFFGRDVSGQKNPMYGRSRKGETHKGGENISKALVDWYSSEEGKAKKLKSSRRLKENNPAKDPLIMEKIKEKWKLTGRNQGKNNPMFGKEGRTKGKKLYNNGEVTKAFIEGQEPKGWIKGRHKIKILINKV